jgi:hypothetical protein
MPINERKAAFSSPKPGCRRCRSSKMELVRVGDELRDRAFVRICFYQTDLLHVCAECEAVWLQQYWEIDTPETMLKEFGERYEVWTVLTRADVALIDVALDTGILLVHERFRDRKSPKTS